MTPILAETARAHLLLVDDHAVVRMGLAHLLANLVDGCEISEAANLPEALAAIIAQPDIALVLLDLHLESGAGAASDPLRSLRELRRRFPLLPVAVISGDPSLALAGQALAEGAAGWLPKSSNARVLGAGLQIMLEGGVYVPPGLVRHERGGGVGAGGGGGGVAGAGAGGSGLTTRQIDVLEQLVRGLSNKEIARTLGMAEPTVKGHLVTIFRILQVRNRAEAVTAGQAWLPGPAAQRRP